MICSNLPVKHCAGQSRFVAEKRHAPNAWNSVRQDRHIATSIAGNMTGHGTSGSTRISSASKLMQPRPAPSVKSLRRRLDPRSQIYIRGNYAGGEGVKLPVDHILRPKLPWRDEPDMTECGLDALKVSALNREQYAVRLKDMGQQRCAMMTCMTCANTASRWGAWDDDPRQALAREIQWENPYGYRSSNERGWRLYDELLAMASIISEHRAVFDAMVSEAQRRREWNEKKAEHRHAKRPATPSRSL